MSDEKDEIRNLIMGWAEAVHAGDLEKVVANHADDIVMFDVPPPDDGVRGMAAYRKTWPPFFSWQANGGSFEIETLEITTGEEVAYAFALLRCGTREDQEENPERRLRISFGLRKEEGKWVVAHEHHSFPLSDAD